MLDIGEIVVFGVHNHADHISFTVSGVIGDFPVGSFKVKVANACFGKGRVVAPVSGGGGSVVGVVAAVIFGR